MVRITGSLPMSPVPLSLSRVQIAISSVAGTPYWRSTRESRAAWRCISCRARLMRAGMTRVAAYSSKLLRKVPRWRRSKASTAPSTVRPAKALSTTDREMPAAVASRPMADRKVLKSPPHFAATAGDAMDSAQTRVAIDRASMLILVRSRWRSYGMQGGWAIGHSRGAHRLATVVRRDARSLDHHVGAGEQGRWDFEAECLGSFQVDHQFVLDRRLHRQIGRLLAPEDAIDIAGCAPVRVNRIGPIGCQAAGIHEEAEGVDRR